MSESPITKRVYRGWQVSEVDASKHQGSIKLMRTWSWSEALLQPVSAEPPTFKVVLDWKTVPTGKNWVDLLFRAACLYIDQGATEAYRDGYFEFKFDPSPRVTDKQKPS